MQKILKAIYDGELRIAESRDASTPEYKSAMMRFTHVQEKIMDVLPKEQRGLVEELSMASADVNGMGSCSLPWSRIPTASGASDSCLTRTSPASLLKNG